MTGTGESSCSGGGGGADLSVWPGSRAPAFSRSQRGSVASHYTTVGHQRVEGRVSRPTVETRTLRREPLVITAAVACTVALYAHVYVGWMTYLLLAHPLSKPWSGHTSERCGTIRATMVARHHRATGTNVAAPPANWGLLLVVVLCLEFWFIVASFLARQRLADHQLREWLFPRWLQDRRTGIHPTVSLIWGDAMTGIVLSGALLFGVRVVIVFLLIAIRS